MPDSENLQLAALFAWDWLRPGSQSLCLEASLKGISLRFLYDLKPFYLHPQPELSCLRVLTLLLKSSALSTPCIYPIPLP